MEMKDRYLEILSRAFSYIYEPASIDVEEERGAHPNASTFRFYISRETSTGLLESLEGFFRAYVRPDLSFMQRPSPVSTLSVFSEGSTHHYSFLSDDGLSFLFYFQKLLLKIQTGIFFRSESSKVWYTVYDHDLHLRTPYTRGLTLEHIVYWPVYRHLPGGLKAAFVELHSRFTESGVSASYKTPSNDFSPLSSSVLIFSFPGVPMPGDKIPVHLHFRMEFQVGSRDV